MLLVAGCVVATPVKVVGDDSGASFGALRVSTPLDEMTRTEADGTESEPIPVRLELEVWGADGSATQSLPNGEFVRLDQVQIDGPADLAIDTELRVGTVGFTFPVHHTERFAVHIAAGLSFQQLDVRVDSGTQAEREEIFGIGPVAGVGVSYDPVERIRLGARLRLNAGFAGDHEVKVVDAEATASIRIAAGLGLTGGWRIASTAADPDSDARSEIEADLSGPFFSIDYGF